MKSFCDAFAIDVLFIAKICTLLELPRLGSTQWAAVKSVRLAISVAEQPACEPLPYCITSMKTSGSAESVSPPTIALCEVEKSRDPFESTGKPQPASRRARTNER